MQTFLQDLKYAVRMFLKQPAFTIIAILTLAIGIGANTTIFSVVNSILLRPLPYREPDRLAMVWMNNARINISEDWHSYPNYEAYRNNTSTFEDIAIFNNRSFNITGDNEPERVRGAIASSNLFPLLGVDAMLGRTFTPEEDENGKDMVAILSYGLWQRRFAADPDILGKTVSLNNANREIIGVMPASFRFPEKDTEMWIPVAPSPQAKTNRNSIWLQAIGRLKPAVTINQAQSDMSAISDRIIEQYPNQEGYRANIVSYHEQIVGNVKPALLVLLGAVAFVLLIACTNVANLLLSRAAAREREVAIRTAVGASRARLVRQFLTESGLLAIIGGAIGVALAYWGLDLLVAIAPSDVPRLDQIRIDSRVLIFSLGMSILTGLVFGLVPALHASKANLNESLKEGGRGTTTGIQGRRVRNSLVVTEVAIALVLLIGAGLMIRSFMHLQRVDIGFNPDNLLTARVQLSGNRYRDNQAAINFYKQLNERIEQFPGVTGAGAISTLFLSKTPSSSNFSIEGRPQPPPTEQVEVPIDIVNQSFFKVMEIPLVRGRSFEERDGPDAPPVIIINETMARRFWPGEDAIGKRMKFASPDSDDPWIEIIGIVGDVRRTGFDAEVRPETFLPHAQAPSRGLMMVIRADSDPSQLASSFRAAVREIDSDQPVFEVRTMDTRLGEMMAQRRLNMILFGIFAAVALLLASVGIYGIISHNVTERTHELGVRMALGASRGNVLKLILRQGMTLTAIGIGFGLAGAFGLTRVMSSLLYGVSATDPLTFVLIALMLGVVALAACLIPARRATKVDPISALRYE